MNITESYQVRHGHVFTHVHLHGYEVMGVPFLVTVEVDEIDRRERTMSAYVLEIEPVNEKEDGDYFNNFKNVIEDSIDTHNVDKIVFEYLDS